MKRSLPPLAALLAFAAVWEAVRVVGNLPPVILPSLVNILAVLFTSGNLYYHLSVTAVEAFTGFVIGNVVALATAICVVRWSKLESAIFPYAIALKTTPVVAFAPILLIWFGYGFASKSIAAAAVCFFPVLINGVHGLRAVEMAYLDLFHTWNASWLQSLRFLRLPTSLPYLFAAMKLSSSLAVVGAIVAEFVAADKGLGFLIVVYSRRLDTPEMFATIVLSTLFGVGWFYGIVVLERMAATRYKFLVQAGEFF